MTLNIKLFATLKDRAGTRSISIPHDETILVTALLEQVAADYPALAESLPISVVAVNRQFADPDTPIHVGDEVALFPPVTGG